MQSGLSRRLLERPRLAIRAVQVAIFVLSGIAAFLLRFEFSIPKPQVVHLAFGLGVWVTVKSAVFHFHQLDRGPWRYVSLPDVQRIASANALASLLSAPVIALVGPAGFPRSLYVIDWLLSFLGTAGVRIAMRMFAEASGRAGRSGARRTLIYGAGAAGVMLLRECRSNPQLGYQVCGLIDDDPAKRGSLIQGVTVLGRGEDLPRLVSEHGVEDLLIALPSATGPEMAAILRRCHDAGVPCRTLPSMAEVIEGRALAGQIREVAVEDLLGRQPVWLDQDAIRSKLQGEVVLVTGAAGSIGSELCRQIARFDPRTIVGFEVAETALFHLEREMREHAPGVEFRPEIGSIQNRKRLAEALRRHEPAVVFHAAAYKHVPMMEAHLFEAVENNILGTYNVAAEAADCGVADFVMISSDKAVRPANIMGATKRAAEIIINSLQNGPTKYVSVRFGNVLGSNGSVVPIFKQQIARGGPLTITHPDMKRYFMTIPEAAQLVLQASTMGKGGEIFVLDMGEPVKIIDLATNLILLSGLRPGVDIEIAYTGVRPGEKLYEELSALNEDTLPTYHEKIKIFGGNGIPHRDVLGRVAALAALCEIRDARALLLELKDFVPEYNPSAQVLRQLLAPESAPSSLTALAAATAPSQPSPSIV